MFDPAAIKQDTPARNRIRASRHIHQGGFAGAVGPDDRGDQPRLETHGHVIDR
jgi:hypothetical protein